MIHRAMADAQVSDLKDKALRYDVLQEVASTFNLDYNAVCRCADAYVQAMSGVADLVGPPWCCEQGERLNVKMCPECAEASRAYSAAAGVVVPAEILRDSDVEEVWQSIVGAMPEADERERHIAFARAVQSAMAVQL